MVDDPNLQLLEAAARLLRPMLDEFVFVGGCATGLLVTDTASAGIRPTIDVDVITEVSSYAGYAALSERLRELGLTEDDSEDTPICRWRHEGLAIDVMPTDERILGFSNRWYLPAIASARQVPLGEFSLRLITPVYFVATKLDAFRGRGAGDYSASHDLEDLITVVDGRTELIDEVHRATRDVRSYIAAEFGKLLNTPAFVDALAGFLLPDAASQARRPLLLERLNALAFPE